MKKHWQRISFIITVIFLFNLILPAAYGADSVQDFSRLQALGIVRGYTDEYGTDFMPGQSITRAEYATLAVSALGLGPVAVTAKGKTNFKDVPAWHWASGHINLAVTYDIISGYPNETFKPEENVSYTEALAIAVRLLGYGPTVQGDWPVNYITKAAQLGLLDNVDIADSTEPATRGEVFQIIERALDTKPLVNGRRGYWEEDGSFLEKRLGVKKYEGTVTGTPLYTGLNMDYVSIRLAGDNTVTLPVTNSEIDPDNYYGLRVRVIEKGDKVLHLKVLTDPGDIKDTTVKSKDAAKKTLTLSASSQTVSVANAVIKKNFADSSLSSLGTYESIKVILDGSGQAAYVLCTSYTTGLVQGVEVSNEKIILRSDGLWPGKSGTINLQGKRVKIFRGAKKISLGEIKKGEVLDYIEAGNACYIIVTDKIKEGKLTSVTVSTSTTWKLNLEEKLENSTISTAKYIYVSTNNGDSFTKVSKSDDFRPVMGQNIKVLLDKSGKAAYVICR
ncbi:MAG: hypothetical protein CVV03_00220 [Firmicutes bacterium HGW-Firmicutes-8]|nr:MAG: hypothetical protein CVV03_00220 [Firmicutes bacterium HGW-Firmicutes-8]